MEGRRSSVVADCNSMCLQARDAFVLGLTHVAVLARASPLGPFALPLDRVALHVELQLFLKHQVRHLDALRAVKGGVGSILLASPVVVPTVDATLGIVSRVCAQLGVGLSRLRLAEETLVHLLLGELEAVLHCLGPESRSAGRLSSGVIALRLLTLVLLEYPKELELLPELLLKLKDLRISSSGVTN